MARMLNGGTGADGADGAFQSRVMMLCSLQQAKLSLNTTGPSLPAGPSAALGWVACTRVGLGNCGGAAPRPQQPVAAPRRGPGLKARSARASLSIQDGTVALVVH